MTTPDIAAIAGKLTKAQRHAVSFSEYHEGDGCWHPMGWYASGDKRVRWALTRLKLTTDYLRRANRLTPLGLLVREYLLRGEG